MLESSIISYISVNEETLLLNEYKHYLLFSLNLNFDFGRNSNSVISNIANTTKGMYSLSLDLFPALSSHMFCDPFVHQK